MSGDLVSTIVLDIAKPENVINFFVQRYDHSQKLARDATRLFVWFASNSDMVISQELLDLAIKRAPRTRSITPKKQQTLPSKLRPRKVRKTTFE